MADDVAQAGYVVERILENREAGITLKSQAVLFRASHHSASLEVELTRRNIPFVKFGGLKFLEAAHIKDVLAVLRWAQNIGDRVAGFRVAQLLPGIGPSSAARLLDRMTDNTDPMQILSAFKPPAAAAEHWPDFEAMIGMLRRNAAGWPSELDLVRRWYTPHLERIHENSALREADLIQLTQIASTYPSREQFLTELTLDPRTRRAMRLAHLFSTRIISSYRQSILPRGRSGNRFSFSTPSMDACPPTLLPARHRKSRRNVAFSMSP